MDTQSMWDAILKWLLYRKRGAGRKWFGAPRALFVRTLGSTGTLCILLVGRNPDTLDPLFLALHLVINKPSKFCFHRLLRICLILTLLHQTTNISHLFMEMISQCGSLLLPLTSSMWPPAWRISACQASVQITSVALYFWGKATVLPKSHCPYHLDPLALPGLIS